MREEELLRREEAILDEIIQYYLAKHEAISARTLAKISQLSLSPTTIRNMMEDLSASGFLTTEGVTRGRIPTQKAFAIYVSKLGVAAPPTGVQPPAIAPMEEGGPLQLESVVQRVGRFLAEESGCVAMALLPGKDYYPLDWVRFFSMPGNRVLVVMQTLFGDLWSKLLLSPERFPDDLLQEVSRFICETYRGASLEAVRSDIMAGEPKEILEQMPSLGAAFRMLRKAFEWQEAPHWESWGEANLFTIREFQQPERLLALHQAIRDPGLLSRTLTRARRIGDGRVAIGTEIASSGLEVCSVVAFPFGWQDWQGWIGILGPMHMDYEQVFYLNAQAASALSEYLETSVQSQERARAG